MPYIASKPSRAPNSEELRARIPGWGADLDPADRPSVPKMRFDPDATGAHWIFPERQAYDGFREKSIEHEMLTPVFGTAVGLKGLSGIIRRYSYAHFSEGRAGHWLLLLGADRVDVLESRVTSLFAGKPDSPVAETGVHSEFTHHGLSSRRARGRVDVNHAWIDPLLIAGPYLIAGAVAVGGVVSLLRRRSA
ncbi:hypothetical protein ASF79_11310 [Agreia sp. Leaf335]|uniref:hypothetical protein n=1 Tax=Agreia sp. Leaf335 TaxID=1736340 RepID=UPI0006F39AD5|nr:hypothetical protein [Agreia sp. Leaf335]KQR20716.1 hypothetical protein ASF79_11310 [Agreia sp. Leaf335]